MKRNEWGGPDPTRGWPPGRSRAAVLLVVWAAAATGVLGWLEASRSIPNDRLHGVKLAAARQMELATGALRAERLRRGLPIDSALDLNATGLIGPEFTPITTTLGDLQAKRTATNPNMAGALVALLGRAGVGPGDCAAVAFSGSFPGLNIAVLSALKAMELRAVIVSSVGASTYGATDPRFTWPDMEMALYREGLFPWFPAAVAPGGVVAPSPLFGEEGLDLVRAAMERSGLTVLEERGEETLTADVDRRMRLYREGCGGRPAMFINVGGGLVSLGAGERAERYPSGLIPPGIADARRRTGLIAKMAEAGVPVIHLLDVRRMAREHGLPVDPVPIPAVPSGRVMTRGGYSRTAAAGGLVCLGVLGWAASRRRG